MGFNEATRRKFSPLPSQTRSSGGVTRFDMPRVGLLARVWVTVRGTINAVTSGPNAAGQASIIDKIRLTLNNGPDIFNVSGIGYNYLLRPYLDAPFDPFPQSTGRSAVANSAAVLLDFVIPCQVNWRDAIGLIMLQNEQTLCSLEVTWASDTTIASGGITWTTQPVITVYPEIFTVPALPENLPPLNMLHQIIEDTQQVSASGELAYSWPRGNLYLQMIHGLGVAVSGSDGFTTAALRSNFTDYIVPPVAPAIFDAMNPLARNQQRLAGTIPWDLMSSTGLGVYDSMRDTIDSRALTDLATVINASGAGTLRSLRRQIVPLL